jgi:hypothetical protein
MAILVSMTGEANTAWRGRVFARPRAAELFLVLSQDL